MTREERLLRELADAVEENWRNPPGRIARLLVEIDAALASPAESTGERGASPAEDAPAREAEGGRAEALAKMVLGPCPFCGFWKLDSDTPRGHDDACPLAAFLAASGAQEGEGKP